MVNQDFKLKIPAKALSLPSSTKEAYITYLYVRSIFHGRTAKPGFVTKKEINRIAKQTKQSPLTLQGKVDRLVASGFITTMFDGYSITSFKSISHKLKLFIHKKNDKGMLTSRTHTPCLKTWIPLTKDERVIRTLFVYFLINQIYSRYRNQNANGATGRNSSRNKRPEDFELGIDKICLRGNYASKMEVWRLLNQLENVELLTNKRGASHGACNRLTTHALSSANWNKLNVKRKVNSLDAKLKEVLAEANALGTAEKTVKNVSRPKITLAKKKRSISKPYTRAELTFAQALKEGLAEILVDYKSFGLNQAYKEGRKVSRPMYANILVHTLNDKELRNILFKVFKPENFQVTTKTGTWKDSRAMYVRNSFFDYEYHHVSLVESGGNYVPGMILNSKGEGELVARNNALAAREGAAQFIENMNRVNARIQEQEEQERRSKRLKRIQIETLMNQYANNISTII